MEWNRGHVIGRGSTATVSLATAVPSGELFAVKSSELSKSMFLQKEKQFLSKLRCPQVVKYLGFDVSEENNTPMYNLFLEYMSGGSLYDLIQANGKRLQEPIIRSYTHQIVKGLASLHSQGIVHCDIKSQNILVGRGMVKIADLGCAKLVERGKGDKDFDPSSVCGTLAFMAPEVARGQGQSFLADIWALGCTIIEMATGNSPWPKVNDPVSVVYRIGLSSDVPEFPSWLSEKAKDFVSKCLMRDPKERWTAQELLEHPFLKELESHLMEVTEIKMGSPSSVLDKALWDSSEELENPTNKVPSLDSPAGRIKTLVEGSASNVSNEPYWTWDEDWITVRSQGMEESQSFSFKNDVILADELSGSNPLVRDLGSTQEEELLCSLLDDDDLWLEFSVQNLSIINISDGVSILRVCEDADDLVFKNSYSGTNNENYSLESHILPLSITSFFV